MQRESGTEKEPRNWLMVSNIPFGFTNRNERTTSKRTPQFSVGISEKLPYHLPSIRNFQNFLSNGKHPRVVILSIEGIQKGYVFQLVSQKWYIKG